MTKKWQFNFQKSQTRNYYRVLKYLVKGHLLQQLTMGRKKLKVPERHIKKQSGSYDDANCSSPLPDQGIKLQNVSTKSRDKRISKRNRIGRDKGKNDKQENSGNQFSWQCAEQRDINQQIVDESNASYIHQQNSKLQRNPSPTLSVEPSVLEYYSLKNFYQATEFWIFSTSSKMIGFLQNQKQKPIQGHYHQDKKALIAKFKQGRNQRKQKTKIKGQYFPQNPANDSQLSNQIFEEVLQNTNQCNANMQQTINKSRSDQTTTQGKMRFQILRRTEIQQQHESETIREENEDYFDDKTDKMKILIQNILYPQQPDQQDFKDYMFMKKQVVQMASYIKAYVQKSIFQQYGSTTNLLHVCKICWKLYSSGHQLGGHMSKKHCGRSFAQRIRRQMENRNDIDLARREFLENFILGMQLKKKREQQHKKSKNDTNQNSMDIEQGS